MGISKSLCLLEYLVNTTKSKLRGFYHFGAFGKLCISWAITVESSPLHAPRISNILACQQWNSMQVQYAPELHIVPISYGLFKVTQFTFEIAFQNLHLLLVVLLHLTGNRKIGNVS